MILSDISELRVFIKVHLIYSCFYKTINLETVGLPTFSLVEENQETYIIRQIIVLYFDVKSKCI